MLRTTLTVLCRAVVLLMVFSLCVGPASSARAQGFGGYGGFVPGEESADSENSLTPFQFKLGGVLNPTIPDAASLAVLKMTVGTYRETYWFEVRTVEAPENPQMSTNQVLKSLNKYPVQLHLVGEKDLLTKIGQSLPNTPVTVTGLLTRRDRQLRVLSVAGFSLDGRPGQE